MDRLRRTLLAALTVIAAAIAGALMTGGPGAAWLPVFLAGILLLLSLMPFLAGLTLQLAFRDRPLPMAVTWLSAVAIVLLNHLGAREAVARGPLDEQLLEVFTEVMLAGLFVEVGAFAARFLRERRPSIAGLLSGSRPAPDDDGEPVPRLEDGRGDEA